MGGKMGRLDKKEVLRLPQCMINTATQTIQNVLLLAQWIEKWKVQHSVLTDKLISIYVDCEIKL